MMISVIIATYMREEALIATLRDVVCQQDVEYEVVVVDNGSKGDEAKVLEERFEDYIHLIKKDRNYGPTVGYNIAMKYAMKNSNPDYLLLLCNDTVVSPEFLTEMVKVVESDKTIGMASAMIYHYDEPNRLHPIHEKINLWKIDIDFTLGLIIGLIRRKILRRKDIYRGQDGLIKEVGHIPFWCALFKRQTVESIGLFAEESFGFESIDYSIKARDAGYKVVYIPSVKIWHKFRSTNKIDGSFQYYGIKDFFRFMKQYSTKWQYWFFIIQFFIIHFWFATIYYLIWHRNPKALLCFYKGVRDGLFKGQ